MDKKNYQQLMTTSDLFKVQSINKKTTAFGFKELQIGGEFKLAIPLCGEGKYLNKYSSYYQLTIYKGGVIFDYKTIQTKISPHMIESYLDGTIFNLSICPR